MEQSFESHGFKVVTPSAPADVVVVNTCTVTENGDADARRLVSRIVRGNPATRIALVGCLAQIQKENLLRMPNVMWVVGNAEKMRLASLILENHDEPIVSVSKIERQPFVHEIPGIDRRHTRANVKIQDGCDFYCSFCIIPFARGPARSRVFSISSEPPKHIPLRHYPSSQQSSYFPDSNHSELSPEYSDRYTQPKGLVSAAQIEPIQHHPNTTP